MNDFITLRNISPSQWEQILQLSLEVKKHPGHFRSMLLQKSTVLLFEKPSLRTRLTFDLGMKQLGGDSVYLDSQDSLVGGRESLYDVAKNLERWFDCIVARTFSHSTVIELAEHADIPVINALTDEEHPCQALADLFTLKERWGELKGRTLVFVGDGNNVGLSLVHATALSGMSFVAITPESHCLPPSAEDAYREMATDPSASFLWSADLDAIKGADAVYTDTWVSMGKEAETEARLRTFQPYQVTPEVMDRAGSESFFMHCLPAHRNQEVTDSVIDSARSLVFDQAENRLHVQKALLLLLMAAREVERYMQLSKWAAAR